MADYISREEVLELIDNAPIIAGSENETLISAPELSDKVYCLPAADVVEEENILKFYYVRSIDEYWIGRRLDTLYYAIYEAENQQWVWAYSRYLPWGEHVVSPTSLWKEYTYPSKPEEISFTDWLKGFSQKYVAAKGRPVVRAHWEWDENGIDWGLGVWKCSHCHCKAETWWATKKSSPLHCAGSHFCGNCGADMR